MAWAQRLLERGPDSPQLGVPNRGAFSARACGSPTLQQALLWPLLPSARPGGGLRAKSGRGSRGSIPERTGHFSHVPVLVKDVSRTEREGLGAGLLQALSLERGGLQAWGRESPP